MAASGGPVVVGTDFSDTAAVALAEGRRLADMLGAAVELVHVVESGAVEGWCPGARAGAWLRAAAVEPGELVVRFGSPWVELVRYAAQASPTLVVVGSHGLTGYQPLKVGSTASRVTVHSRCPVVLVSPRMRAQAAERVPGRVQERRTTTGRVEAAAGARPGPGEP
jgi:nucleotide-binding universal stress UspA family protein